MNFYNEIKKELIDNEIYKKVKDYSKNSMSYKSIIMWVNYYMMQVSIMEKEL